MSIPTIALRAAALVGVFGSVLLMPAAVAAGDPCLHSFDRPPTSSGATSTVAIGDCVFTPTVTHVAAGTSVVFRNASGQAHEVVGANLEWGAHDKLLAPGDTIGWTFDRDGVYPYTCLLHPGMTGAVVVGTASASGEAASSVSATTSGPAPADDPLPLRAVGLSVVGLLAVAVILGVRHASRASRTEA